MPLEERPQPGERLGQSEPWPWRGKGGLYRKQEGLGGKKVVVTGQATKDVFSTKI